MANHAPGQFLSVNLFTPSGQAKTSLKASYHLSDTVSMDITYPDVTDEQDSFVVIQVTMGGATRRMEVYQETWLALSDQLDDMFEFFLPVVAAGSEIHMAGFHVVKMDDDLLRFTATDENDELHDDADHDNVPQNVKIKFELDPLGLQRLSHAMDRIAEREVIDYLDLVYFISEE